MRTPHFILQEVVPTSRASLQLLYADGARFDVSLVDLINTHPMMGALKSRKLFETARVGEFGHTVEWPGHDDLELAADNLRAWGVEQAGDISHEFIYRWMHENDLNLDTAAEALGMSRRMLAYYRSGAKPVPRTVALACLGWEALRKWRASRQLPLAA